MKKINNHFSKLILLLLFGFFLMQINLSAQTNANENKQHFMLGILPSITVEPFYEEGEFDFNLIPLVAGFGLNRFIDLKIGPMLNMHFADKNNISHIGLQLVTPFYFFDIFRNFKQKKIFTGPLLAFSYNVLSHENELTAGIEAGYTFLFENDYELKIGIQEGNTSFFSQLKNIKNSGHFGIKISFSKWLF